MATDQNYNNDALQDDTSLNTDDLVLGMSEPSSGGVSLDDLQPAAEQQTPSFRGAGTAGEDTGAALPTFTISQISNYLQQGYWTDRGGNFRSFNLDNSGGAGFNANRTLQYNYSGFSNISGAGTDSDGISTARRALVDHALDYIGAVLNINFVQTTSTGTDVDIFFKDNGSGAAANASLFGSGNGTANHRYTDYAWVNVASSWSGGTSTINDYTYQTFIHEIFHTLGLGHGGNYNFTSNFVTDTTDPNFGNNSNHYLNDSWQQSIMSYFSQDDNTTVNADFNYVITGMAADWQALRNYYGSAAFLGNTTYGFNTNISATTSQVMHDLSTYADETTFNIVDDGGTDTLDFSGYAANQNINLAVASSGSTTGTISDIGGQTGNMTLAIGTVIENATGGSGSDTINGNSANNLLKGGGGNDTLYGQGGVDTLGGEDGNDSLYGGDGNDSMDGGAGNDLLKGGGGADSLDGGDGVDTADYSDSTSAVTVNLTNGTGSGGSAAGDTLSGIENVIGSSSADVLAGDANANSLSGGGGDDILTSGDGLDTLTGSSGADTLKGGGGADVLNGGSDIDTASYVDSTAGVTVSLTTGAGTGGDAEGDKLSAIENLTGSNSADTLSGNNVANILAGSGGDDQLKGGGGADTLNGGSGIDAAIYSDSGVGVTVNLTAGTGSGGTAQGDKLSAIENVLGSGLADSLGGNDLANGLSGSGGDDALNGGLGNDTLDGGTGDDFLKGGGGADTLIGGDGIDTASYVDSSAVVRVNLLSGTATGGDAQGDTFSGVENVTGSANDDVLVGDANVNNLQGQGGDDSIEGGAGADVLGGGAGKDTASYAGSDVGVSVDLAAGIALGGHAEGDALTGFENLTGSAFDDTLNGDTGNNTLTGGDGNDDLSGGDGSDKLSGGGGNDDLIGGVGNDKLNGGGGVDNITGNGGSDQITGGGGQDTLSGGGADDIFVYTAVSDSQDGGNKRDIIVDFVQLSDVIDLSAIDAIAGGIDNIFNFIGSAAFSGAAGELRYSQQAGSTLISADVDGGGADFQISLTGLFDLTIADFVL